MWILSCVCVCLYVNFTCSYFLELFTIVLPPLRFSSYRVVSGNRQFTLSSPVCLWCLLSRLNDTSLQCLMLLFLRERFWSLTVKNRARCGFIYGLYYEKVDSACHQFVQCIVIGWCWNLSNTFLYWLKWLYLLFSSCSIFWNEVHMQMEIYQRNESFLFLKVF